ncbi:MAG: hypothetical protein IKD23_07620, partial [Lentisphaeria bacterium]|nr:hypothetical protein [Lentisphaeria bacterium]
AVVHCGQSLGKSADVFAVMYVSTLLLIRLDLSATLPHTASTGWIEPVLAGLTNHNLCDMFYTLAKIFVYKLLLRVLQNSGHYRRIKKIRKFPLFRLKNFFSGIYYY